MEKVYYRPKEAAAYLGIGLSTVFLYMKLGMIQRTKLGTKITVITKNELDRFAQTQV